MENVSKTPKPQTRGLFKIFTGAAWIAAGSFFVKLLGALYRIPLAAYLGAEGLGLYQMAFPAYTALLDVSSAGIPGALSKLVATHPEKKTAVLKKSLIFFGGLGLALSAVLFFGAPYLAFVQGDVGVGDLYRALSPAVFLVSLLACFRGYFQGELKMYPTALSQIVEQLFKFGLGVLFLHIGSSIKVRATGAVGAVSLSALFALLFLVFLYLGKRKKDAKISPLKTGKESGFRVRDVLRVALPVTVLTLILPLSNFLESVCIVRFLGGGVKEYGLYSGAATAVVHLPVSVCYGFAAVAVPLLAKDACKREQVNNREKERTLLFLTAGFAVAGAILTAVFAPFITRLFFSGFSAEDAKETAFLIRGLSPSIIGLAVLQTQNASFIAKSKTKIAIFGTLTGSLVKIGLTAGLLLAGYGIWGAVFATNLAYLLAIAVNFLYSKYDERKTLKNRKNRNRKQRAFGTDGGVHRRSLSRDLP